MKANQFWIPDVLHFRQMIQFQKRSVLTFIGLSTSQLIGDEDRKSKKEGWNHVMSERYVWRGIVAYKNEYNN